MNWSLVVSIAALVVSGFACWYARRQYQLNVQERGSAPWVVMKDPQTSDGMLLVNGKSWPVFDIELTVADGVYLKPSRFTKVDGHSPVVVFVAESLAAPLRSSVEITWSRRPGGPKDRWSHPLMV